jgi:hypothetical protein
MLMVRECQLSQGLEGLAGGTRSSSGSSSEEETGVGRRQEGNDSIGVNSSKTAGTVNHKRALGLGWDFLKPPGPTRPPSTL